MAAATGEVKAGQLAYHVADGGLELVSAAVGSPSADKWVKLYDILEEQVRHTLPFAALSRSFTAFHRLSPPFTALHCLSLPFTAFHRLSPRFCCCDRSTRSAPPRRRTRCWQRRRP